VGLTAVRSFLLLVFCVLTSCADPVDEGARNIERALEAQLPDGATADIDLGAESITVEDDDGIYATGRDLEAPAWIDAAMPLPADLVIETVLTVGDIESLRGTTEVASDDYLRDVEAALREAGWTIDLRRDDAGASILQATDTAGIPVDIELGSGELAIVTGRIRSSS